MRGSLGGDQLAQYKDSSAQILIQSCVKAKVFCDGQKYMDILIQNTWLFDKNLTCMKAFEAWGAV